MPSVVIVTADAFNNEVSWKLTCDRLTAPIAGGGPYSESHATSPGSCTLDLFDSYGDGWQNATWSAPGWTDRSFTIANGFNDTFSFVVNYQPPPPLPPPSPPPSPPPQRPSPLPCSDSCTDVVGPFASNVALPTCAAASLAIPVFDRLCDGETLNNQNWPVSVTCQQSCADAGHNYADPPCCISLPPLSP